MKTKYLIRRGKPLNLDLILMEGEMAICQTKNKFYGLPRLIKYFVFIFNKFLYKI